MWLAPTDADLIADCAQSSSTSAEASVASQFAPYFEVGSCPVRARHDEHCVMATNSGQQRPHPARRRTARSIDNNHRHTIQQNCGHLQWVRPRGSDMGHAAEVTTHLGHREQPQRGQPHHGRPLPRRSGRRQHPQQRTPTPETGDDGAARQATLRQCITEPTRNRQHPAGVGRPQRRLCRTDAPVDRRHTSTKGRQFLCFRQPNQRLISDAPGTGRFIAHNTQGIIEHLCE